jgi:hypothetical protein
MEMYVYECTLGDACGHSGMVEIGTPGFLEVAPSPQLDFVSDILVRGVVRVRLQGCNELKQ